MVETTPPMLVRPNACVSRLYSPTRGPPLGMRRAFGRIDPHALHPRQVNDEATIADGVAGDVMTASAHGHQQIVA